MPGDVDALGKRIARLEAAVKRLEQAQRAAQAEAERNGLAIDALRGKMDALLLRIAAFTQGGAVLILKHMGIEQERLPPRGGPP